MLTYVGKNDVDVPCGELTDKEFLCRAKSSYSLFSRLFQFCRGGMDFSLVKSAIGRLGDMIYKIYNLSIHNL